MYYSTSTLFVALTEVITWVRILIYIIGARAEVYNFVFSFGTDQYVLHLDISMCYALMVQVLQNICHDHQNVDNHLFVQIFFIALLQDVEGSADINSCLPWTAFLHEEKPEMCVFYVQLIGIVELYDVGMRDRL